MGKIANANMQDALNLEYGKIMVDGDELGYVSGVTIDGKAPEDLINTISGTLRRRKPSSVEWSADAVVLYNNLVDLQTLTDGRLFQIVMVFTNPDTSNPSNTGMVLTISECRVQDHTININDASTFKMSGRARDWTVTQG